MISIDIHNQNTRLQIRLYLLL